MTTSTRRYDIDWVRVIAIGLLLIYHIAIGFQPWGVFIGFLQNEAPLESLWIPMSLLNVFRIPLLFFVSGMGVCFAMKKRNWKQLFQERSQRIFLPFLFGIFTIVPLHILIWQLYYNQIPLYKVNPGHLWFLGNIMVYVILLSPLFFYLKRNPEGKVKHFMIRVLGNPIGLVLIAAFFVVETWLVAPELYPLFAMTYHGFFLGFLAFLFGFCFIYVDKPFWKSVLKWRWMFLAIASIMFGYRFLVNEMGGPNYLMAIETLMWVYTVFGFSYRHLNRPSKVLNYLSAAAYPVYIIHMAILYLGSYLLFPLTIDPLFKFILLLLFVTIGCFIVYEFCIRRINLIRPLFGLKTTNKNNEIVKETIIDPGSKLAKYS